MKLLLLLPLILFCSIIAKGQASINPIAKALETFTKDTSLTNASISFHCVDLTTQETIASYNENLSLPPASTMKLYSTALAYETLGSSFKPSTRIYTDGYIDSNGVLQGNIWIRGGGDPSLGSNYFEEDASKNDFLNDWVNALLKKNITSINGGIIADGSEFGYNGVPDGWSWGDIGNYYGAGPSGCVVFDNMLKFEFKTSSSVDELAELIQITPPVEGLNFRNEIVSDAINYDNAYIYGGPYSLEQFGKGSLPRGRSSFIVKGSIPDPEFLLAQEFHNALQKHLSIVSLPKCVRTTFPVAQLPINYSNKTLIYEHPGKSIDAIAYWTNQKSVNLFAEQLNCLVAYHQTGNGSISSAVSTSTKFWKNILDNGFVIDDGSGLSRKNASSAKHFTQLLDYMYQSSNYEDFKQSLAISGKSGTLAGLCQGQNCFGKIHAKSGTMNRIKSYAGYVFTNSGKKLAFSVIVNNASCTNRQLTYKIQNLFNAMSNY